MTATPKHRLRWYQYSLRSLFVLMIVVAIAGSWFAVKKQQKERERAAVKAIKAAGGVVLYDYEWDFAWGFIPNEEPPGPAWLRAWLGDDFFAHVVFVGLPGEAVTDAGLEHLKGLTQLKRLYLEDTRVTDAGLKHLRGLTQLEVLELRSAKVTDAGLEHLKRLTELKDLSLDNTRVTDAGLEHLKGMTQLAGLSLVGTQVTNSGLEHLKVLTKLEYLNLEETKVTHEGVKKLQEALPNCKIVR
jgi:hypothetical protein